MPFNYGGNPAASVKDAVRFEIADTNPSAPLLQDAEIEYAISQEAPGVPPTEGEVLSAAARCTETLARLFAMQADTQVGDLQVTYSKMAATYADRAKELRTRAAGMHAPFAGGLSVSEKEQRERETDRVQPEFRKGQFKAPYTQQPGEGGLIEPGRQGE